MKTNEFTKTILPRHFKHSNFASFVRQLNKYDFHKVRTAAAGESSAYGENAWEFKHPDFLHDNKDQLDNIKRKIPSTRKANNTEASQEQISRLESELTNIQAFNNELTMKLTRLNDSHQMTLQHLTYLQNAIKTRDDIFRQMITTMASLSSSSSSNHFDGRQLMDFASALNIMDSTPVDAHSFSSHLLSNSSQKVSSYGPTDSYHELRSQQRSISVQKPGLLLDNLSSTSVSPTLGNNVIPPTHKPYSILLVEDDEVGVRICRKFLTSFGCEVDVANDGLSAVNRMQSSSYDLVLMDIVMPALDGVNATVLIRNFNTTTPIIAMTGNVKNADVVNYFQRGMNDVLGKPFTKDDLLKMLRKHLDNDLKQASQPQPLNPLHITSVSAQADPVNNSEHQRYNSGAVSSRESQQQQNPNAKKMDDLAASSNDFDQQAYLSSMNHSDAYHGLMDHQDHGYSRGSKRSMDGKHTLESHDKKSRMYQ